MSASPSQPVCCKALVDRGFKFVYESEKRQIWGRHSDGRNELAVEICYLGRNDAESHEVGEQIAKLMNGQKTDE